MNITWIFKIDTPKGEETTSIVHSSRYAAKIEVAKQYGVGTENVHLIDVNLGEPMIIFSH